jgi:hypothetical protein
VVVTGWLASRGETRDRTFTLTEWAFTASGDVTSKDIKSTTENEP